MDNTMGLLIISSRGSEKAGGWCWGARPPGAEGTEFQEPPSDTLAPVLERAQDPAATLTVRPPHADGHTHNTACCAPGLLSTCTSHRAQIPVLPSKAPLLDRELELWPPTCVHCNFTWHAVPLKVGSAPASISKSLR